MQGDICLSLHAADIWKPFDPSSDSSLPAQAPWPKTASSGPLPEWAGQGYCCPYIFLGRLVTHYLRPMRNPQ